MSNESSSVEVMFNVSNLAEALKKSAEAIPSKVVLPVQSYSLLKIAGSVCEITSGSTEMQIRTQVSCSSKKDFSVCIPSDDLINILSGFPEEEVRMIITKGKNGEVFANIKTINGKRSYKLPIIRATEFNVLRFGNTTSRVVVDGNDFQHAFSFASLPVNPKNLVNSLQGIRFLVENDRINMCGTEGNWFNMSEAMATVMEGSAVFIAHKKSMAFIPANSNSPVTIEYDGSMINVSWEGVSGISACIDATYPRIEELIKRMPEEFVELGREEMNGICSRLSRFCDPHTSGLKMIIGPSSVVVEADASTYGKSGTEEMPCVDQGLENVSFITSVRYLTPTLKNFRGDSVEIHTQNKDNVPIFIKQSGDSSVSYVSGIGKLRSNGQ
jgi:DNA polymerase-3 subunit beta